LREGGSTTLDALERALPGKVTLPGRAVQEEVAERERLLTQLPQGQRAKVDDGVIAQAERGQERFAGAHVASTRADERGHRLSNLLTRQLFEVELLIHEGAGCITERM